MLRPIAISSLIVSICLLFVDVVSMAPPGAVWGDWWTVLRLSPPLKEGGGIAVVCDHDAILADLTVTVLFCQIIAQIIGAILIGGGVLPRGGGADHVVAGHESFRLIDLSMAPIGGQWGKWWTPPQVSHAVEHLTDRLLILLISGEAISEASGHDPRGRGHVLADLPLGVTLGHEVGDVGVVAHVVSFD